MVLDLSRVAVLNNPGNPFSTTYLGKESTIK
jgi:hypothetical protein